MSNQTEAFLSKTEEEEIVDAIRQAERTTSGEIRVHLEPSTKGMDIFERAMEVFHALKKWITPSNRMGYLFMLP